ncbi:MAG: alpha-amylase [Sphingomonas sp.]|uniref:alpha-amylase family glycosyl hydrolase n=1 Tax=Sphingomonas sp. TaxID=28214 RepID=UPI0025F1D02C|nr:alpha-amylase family glycosyl hydrolase [Sphingomonas sp.]MBY0284988.1 alpha-amylase [Sphingomonas sp.]
MRLLALMGTALALVTAFPATAQVPPRYTPKPYVTLTHPAWSRDATLYQLNTRQFTPEGTFKAAEAQLPRLKALGIDIVWLMPIHPIGVKNRKGSLGSPYAVRDYRAVNPEFGTMADLKRFVAAAHKLGMHVILDWVANHSAWDNPLTTQHPDWYDHDWKGDFRPTPWFDWSDIIDFDYSKPGLRQYMTQSMAYWVREAGVDGFRCDVAGLVPVDFWDNVRAELSAIKPVFMLAEADTSELHRRAFDASYAWMWGDTLANISQGKAGADALYGYYSATETSWPHEAMRMLFTSNHDKNSWEGTEFERFGPNLDNAIVLTFVSEGLPLIYNGQEAGNAKRLAFFERDPIAWRDHPNGALFKRLIALKKAHPALWNGQWGARMVPVVNSAPAQVLSFTRTKGTDKFFALFNMSDKAVTVSLKDGPYAGRYIDWEGGAAVTLGDGATVTLPAWSHRVLTGAK